MKILKLFGVYVIVVLLTVSVTFADDEDDSDDDDKGTGGIEDVEEDLGVLVLTDDNFDRVLEQYPIALVEFYAPWCGHCKSLEPEYARAAALLREAPVPVPLCKVDATQNEGLGKRFDVTGYPTLKFMKDGEWSNYDGPREADGIVQWVNEKADPNYKPPPSAVVTVTQDNIEEFINSQELVLLEFYAPWCGHCKRLAPEYEKAAKTLLNHDPPIPLGKVDATQETELATEYGVSGYPTLKMFRNGKMKEYNGPREEFGITEYMRKQSGEAAKLLPTMRDVKNVFGKELATVIGFFDNLNDPALKIYMEYANDRREDLTFGYTLLPEARDVYKANPGTVIVFTAEKFYTKYEPKYHHFKMEGKSLEDLGEFVKEMETPLVGQYSQKTDKFYADHGKKTLCLAFYTVDWTFDHRDATQLWRNKVASVAKDFKDVKFAIASEDEYITSLMKEFGLDESGEEFNVGCFKDMKKYRMEPMDEFDEDEMKEFVKKLQKGKLEPRIKSQPEPKKNSGPVKVVVGKTFDKIVKDKKKDVLIEMYAPWCGHCKNLEPIYKDLGKALKKEKNVVIAKIDATANDIPEEYKVEGFPTIYFAPANNKNNPVKYDGERTLEGFKTYLENHATVSFGKTVKDEL